MMDKVKESTLPIITLNDIVETVRVAGKTPTLVHELVFPPCFIDNTNNWLTSESLPWSIAAYIPIESIVSYKLFDYDVRCDPNAHAMDIVPKQVEEPLPFE